MSSCSDTVEALVTFVWFQDEVMAFFRAYRTPGKTAWDKVETRVKGSGKYAYLAQEGYVHCGQHGEFDVEILRRSRRATPAEYADLRKELESIGYVVTPHQKGRLKLKGR